MVVMKSIVVQLHACSRRSVATRLSKPNVIPSSFQSLSKANCYATSSQTLSEQGPTQDKASQRAQAGRIRPTQTPMSQLPWEEQIERSMSSIRGDFADSETDKRSRSLTFAEERTVESYHLHVYSTKHNTHITLTNPQRNPQLSLSAGNLSFRKANRGTYDAAYQLASYVFNRIQEQGWLKDIKYLEVVLRGFGIGREAVTKAILGQEGQALRSKIVRVTDSTRLKFGGTRSPKPRRLG